ncbi:chromosome partitioning protein [Steroidobacter denitrificans]|uniref:Chromosome partitioning protein n=1 Tax=Steroidobacter denitrificans TaxID=465721 RepID=A0A127FCS6_STEDE|nr:AAA family ATPase [Steroidobacter denitrificans]AMN47480.1 chromosome partitioning protein [Steroidobacter denitrificans]
MTPRIAFFNNKGGVGKTSLVYHCAFMFAEQGQRVLAVDLDPQSNLSIMALDESRLEALWPDNDHPLTINGALAPLFEGTGDVRAAHIEPLSSRLGLLVGDLALSRIEDDLSIQWPRCLEGDTRAFRVTTAFWRIIEEAARRHQAGLVLVDVGPNLGAINRSALVASSHVVMPVAPDLFSLQGLKNLGPTLRKWRGTWASALPQAPNALGAMPQGEMSPVGYVLMQHAERLGRPTKAYAKWQKRLPITYRESVLDVDSGDLTGADDNQIQRIKHYRSLMPMAMEARKPMFSLRSADGAIGAHQANVQQCYDDFSALVTAIANRTGIKEVA